MMKREEVDQFEKLNAQLESLHSEMSALAKKSANDGVNKFKLNLINATLVQCNSMLGPKYRPFEDFTTFDSDVLPSNSDVSFVIAQYIECAEKFRSDNLTQLHGAWYWDMDVMEDNRIRTKPPKRLGGKE